MQLPDPATARPDDDHTLAVLEAALRTLRDLHHDPDYERYRWAEATFLARWLPFLAALRDERDR